MYTLPPKYIQTHKSKTLCYLAHHNKLLLNETINSSLYSKYNILGYDDNDLCLIEDISKFSTYIVPFQDLIKDNEVNSFNINDSVKIISSIAINISAEVTSHILNEMREPVNNLTIIKLLPNKCIDFDKEYTIINVDKKDIFALIADSADNIFLIRQTALSKAKINKYHIHDIIPYSSSMNFNIDCFEWFKQHSYLPTDYLIRFAYKQSIPIDKQFKIIFIGSDEKHMLITPIATKFTIPLQPIYLIKMEG